METSEEEQVLEEEEGMEVDEHNQMVSKNRLVLDKLICLATFVATVEQERDYSTDEEDANNANSVTAVVSSLYKSTHELFCVIDPLHGESFQIADYDTASLPVLKDLLKSLATVVTNAIKQEVNDAPFVAIILYQTPGYGDCDWKITTVLRYVAKDCKLKERFVGYADRMSIRTADDLLNHIVKIIDKFQLGDKLVAQSYDGNVGASYLQDICARVVKKYPTALVVNCSELELSKVMEDACSEVKECRDSLSRELHDFFSKYPLRSHRFKTFITQVLPDVPPSMWLTSPMKKNTVWDFLRQFIDFCDDIAKNPDDWHWRSGTTGAASWLLYNLTNSEDCFILKVFGILFEHTDELNNHLKTNQFNTQQCYEKVQATKAAVASESNNFEEIYGQVKLKIAECDLDREPREPRRSEEECKDVWPKIFSDIIGVITDQLTTRFSSLKQLEFIALLDPEKFVEYNDTFPESSFTVLQETYPTFFDFERLRKELCILYGKQEFQNKLPHELVAYFRSRGINSLAEVYKLASLYLTLPCALTFESEYFSTIRRIDSYSRPTENQEWLENMAFLFIEQEFMHLIQERPDYKALVTEEFVKLESKEKFIFK